MAESIAYYMYMVFFSYDNPDIITFLLWCL